MTNRDPGAYSVDCVLFDVYGTLLSPSVRTSSRASVDGAAAWPASSSAASSPHDIQWSSREMSKKSAGLLLFRKASGTITVLLVHPGGPFWARKDQGAWSIPKGEFSNDENSLQAAIREFNEELGEAVTGAFVPLSPQRQASGKTVYAWAVRSDFDPARLKSNTFSMEWPPRSGRQRLFPEIDRAAWFPLDVARDKISKGQVGFLDELNNKLERQEITLA